MGEQISACIEEVRVRFGSEMSETERFPRGFPQVDRVQEGLIIIAYRADAARGGEQYQAYCTSTYCQLGEHDWRVIQHQQTVPPTA